MSGEPSTEQRPYGDRIEVGAFYTDGQRLAEVIKNHALGYIDLRDCATGQEFGRGLVAFRREFWLVKQPVASDAGEARP